MHSLALKSVSLFPLKVTCKDYYILQQHLDISREYQGGLCFRGLLGFYILSRTHERCWVFFKKQLTFKSNRPLCF